MITRDDRDILRKTLLIHATMTTAGIEAKGWERAAWSKLKEFEAEHVTQKVGGPKPPFHDMGAIEWELTESGRTLLEQSEPEASATRFLRFGAWCECECSCNSATTNLEAGVSVYECYEDGAFWRYIDARAITKNELVALADAVGHFLRPKLELGFREEHAHRGLRVFELSAH